MDLAVGQNRRIVVGIDIDSHTVRVHQSATVAGGRDSAVVKRIRVVQGVHGGPVVRFVESDRNRAFDWEPLVAHKPEQVDNILLQGFVHYDLSPVEFPVERIILNIGNRQTIQYLLRSRRPKASASVTCESITTVCACTAGKIPAIAKHSTIRFFIGCMILGFIRCLKLSFLDRKNTGK